MAETRGRDRPRPSWGDDVVYTDDVSAIKLKLLLKGGVSVGKTTFMGTGEDVFIIDAETGLLTLFRDHIPSYPLGRKAKGQYYKRTMQILDTAEVDGISGNIDFSKIKSIGLDSVSKLNELFLQDIMNRPSNKDLVKPGFDEWGELNNQIVNVMNRLLQLDKHVMVAVGEATKTDENERQYHTLNMRGSYKDYIEHEFDFVLWMKRDTDRAGNDTFTTTGKCMAGRTGKMRGIQLDAKMDSPNFSTIFGKIEEEIAKRDADKAKIVDEVVD